MRLAIRIFMIMVLGVTITVVTSSSAFACGSDSEASELSEHHEPETDSSDRELESGQEHADVSDASGGQCPEKESGDGCQDCTNCSCCPALSTSVLAVSTTLPPPHELPEFAEEPSDYDASASPGFVPGIFKPPRA